MALNFALHKLCIERVSVLVEQLPCPRLKALRVSADVARSVLEIRASVALPLSVYPVPRVINSVELVVGEVVDGSGAVRNLGISKSPPPFHLAFVEPGV